ncbi:MAG: energy-coupling factor transporter ATPase [Ktedonobacteraceae bacterium]
MQNPLPLVSAIGFGYRYHSDDPWVVHDLTISLQQGDWLVLTGASGSGKSTFASALNGIVPHFYGGQGTGMLHVCGLDPAEMPMSTTFRSVGVMFHDPTTQLLGTTVERELTFGLESMGRARHEIAAHVKRVAATLGIAHLLHREPHQLSGGEQQLVLLAAFVALAPQVLVLDEPMTMLDARARYRVRDTLRAMHSQTHGLVVVDHQLDDYGDLASHFVLMTKGTMSCQGTPREVVTTLLRNPKSGVAPPAATRWWNEYILPVQKPRHENLPLPLTLREAQQGIEHLPSNVLENLPSSFPESCRPTVEQFTEKETFCIYDKSAGQIPRVEWTHVTYSYTSTQGKRWSEKKRVHTAGAENALHDICEVLWPGEIVALLGPNGAGKSTLLRTLNGLVRPQQGEVRISGKQIGQRPIAELAHIVGYAPQRPERLFFCQTVAEELAVGPRALRIDMETKEWQNLLIESLELTPFLHRSPYTLSMGQQRKVGLAAVLASHPQVVALDEPTAGLDEGGRATLATLLHQLATNGVLVLVATHDIEFAATVASRWLVLVAGRLRANDTPTRVMMNSALLVDAALEPSYSYQLNMQLRQRLIQGHTA